MTIVDHNNNKLAFKFTLKDIPEGLGFFSEDKDFLQVGSWHYPKGKKLLAHIHNKAPREISHTQEFIFVVRGSLKASVYDQKRNLIEEVTLGTHEGLILFSGGHGYEILEDDTLVIETKNGPYVGAEQDRTRFESAA